MAAISKIKIDGFKAFPKEFELVLDGKNLLMYGENGSGKSSIYYALHALLQSQYHDKGSIYFDKNNSESLVNKYTTIVDPYIELELEGSNTKYHLSKNGYEEIPHQPISPLRDMNSECVFINHKFLFHGFSFRNSQYIDLFPVFIKDILPFILTRDNSEYIGNIYDEVMKGIRRHGSSNQIEDSYRKRIEKFNSELQYIINLINLNASNIYKKYFQNENERNLKIILEYADNQDKVPHPNKSYWLRCSYRYQRVNKAGAWKEKQVSSGLEILQPSIMLKIEEEANDVYKQIEKPQTYFNEARLTAIILSIRFSLLDTIAKGNGRFMALDDMLISLDMSNRAKVIDFLLNISDKYKIYLFTHDRAFYNFICHKIEQYNLSNSWVYKTISYSKKRQEPIVIDEHSDYLSKAKSFYELGDYETSAINLRKYIEQSVKGLLPYELSTDADGKFLELEKLWKRLITFYSNNGNAIDLRIQKLFSDSKLLILNPAAHFQRLSTPIYRTELDQVFDIVNSIQSLNRIDNKLIIEGGKQITFHHPTINYKCSFELDSDLEIIQDEHIVARIPKCKNIKWSYNNIENWDFETNSQNNAHVLLKASPNLKKFFESCCQKLPLGITHDMLMHNCKIDNKTSLIEFFGKVDLLKIAVKIKK